MQIEKPTFAKMHRFNAVALFFLLVTSVFGKYFILGPAGIIIHKTEQCKEFKNLPIKLDIIPKYINKTTQVLDGVLYVPYDVDSDVGIKLKCGRKEKNTIKQNAFTLEDNHLCETLNSYVGPLWWYMEEEVGMEPKKCPIKKGNYTLNNFFLDLTKMKVQMILEGKFFTRIQFIKNKNVVFCSDFELETYKRV